VIGPHDVVAAGRGGTGVQAIIGIDAVAVIATLTLLNHTIAAGRGVAVVARVGGVVVAVVAAFARADDAITAARLDAGRQTGVGVNAVAVVAGFVAVVSGNEVVALKAIAADREFAIICAPITGVGIAVIAAFKP
jgi:hypothetical protein